jgi:hypothetical protein
VEWVVHSGHAMANRNGTSSSTIFLYMGALTLLVSVAKPDESLVRIPVSYILKNRLHATATEVSLFSLLAGIPIYAAFVFGLVRDLWNPFGLRDRGFFLLFGPAAMLAFVWMAFAPLSYRGVLVGTLLATLAFQFVVAAQSGLLSLIGQEKAMSGQLSSLWMVALMLPSIAAGITSGYLTEHVSPRGTFLLIAGLGLLVGCMGLWKPRSVFGDVYEAPQARGTNLVGDLKRLVRHKAIYPALLIPGLWMFVPGTGTPLLFYLTDHLHASDATFSYFRGILAFCNIPGFLVYGYLCKRFALNKLLWWGTALATPGLLPLAFVHSSQLALLAATMSLTWGFAWAAYMDLGIRSCPPGLQGTMMMLVAGATALLTNAGDLVGSKLYSLSEAHGFQYCVIGATVTTALILPAILLVPKELMATADGERSPVVEGEMLAEVGEATAG